MIGKSSSKEAIADRLTEARRRTYELIEPLDDEQLNRVYSPLLSPLAWDLGHIANFEELWLVQTIGEREPLRGELGRFYDAIENPRKNRGELPILRDAELRSYLADVRERTLDVLDEVEIGDDAEDPLLREGFVYEMLIAHEQQHNETMLQLLQMVDGYEPPRPTGTEPIPPGSETIAIEGGEYEIGAPVSGFAYDNERPRHGVELARFEIDRTPVTNGAYIAYMEETGAAPPLYWEGDAEAGWVSVAMGRREPVASDPPRRPRLLARGRRLRPLGRQAPAQRAGVGGGLPPPRRGRPGLGVDPFGLSRLPRLQSVPLPRVLGGLLRRRVQGAAGRLLGDPSRSDAAELPQLGPAAAPPDLLRLPLRTGRRPMSPAGAAEAIEIEVHLRADGGVAMAHDIRLGLTTKPKELSPKYFYDERGSQLFERITELPEYYPTRAEREILRERSAEIVAAAGEPGTLVELGSGSAAKTRHLLSAMRDAGCLATYVPVDISEEITRATAESLVEEYPGLTVRGLVCDFEHDLERIPNGGDGRLVAFLGGTIGNLYPDARRDFLARIAALLEPGDRILLGTDLVKEPSRLEAAYDDAAGVTAEFNKNVLFVLNRELGGDFDPDRFEHVARYDARCGSHGHSPALARRADGAARRPRPDRALRCRRGDADRDLHQVHPRGARRRLPRGWPAARRMVHRRGE